MRIMSYLNENIICKTNSIGIIIWQKNLGLSVDYMGPKNMAQDYNQNIYISGTLGTFTRVHPFLLKLNNNGAPAWFYEYTNNAENDTFYNADIKLTADNNLVLLNHSYY